MKQLPRPLSLFKGKAEELLTKIEESRGAHVVPVMYSMNRFISKPDVDSIYEQLSSIGKVPKLDVILFSRGGDPDQAYLIGCMFQEFAEEKLTFIIPRYAKSAATLMACAADEIVMTPVSELGPIDLVVEREGESISVLSLMESMRVVAKMDLGEVKKDVIKNLLQKISTTELGDYDRLVEHMVSLAEKLLSKRMFQGNEDLAHSIAEKLCKGYKSHRACITLSDLRELGIKSADISVDTMNDLWDLHKLWVETVVKYENDFPKEAKLEPVEFQIGKGIVFSTQPLSET